MRIFKRKWKDAKTGETRESAEWFLEYWLDGRKHQHKTSPPTTWKRVAEQQLAAYVAGLAPGGVSQAPATVTMADVIDPYCVHLQREAASTWRSCKGRLAWWRERFGHLPADEVSLDMIEEAADELRKSKAAWTVYGYLNILKSALHRAVKRTHLLEHHPGAFLEIKDRGDKRTSIFSPAEIDAVCSHLPPWAASLVRLAVTTGIRESDLFGLRWENVKEDRIAWRQQKTKEDTVIPLTDEARIVLAGIPQVKGTDLLFPRTSRTKGLKWSTWDIPGLQKVWWPALEAEGLSWLEPKKKGDPKGKIRRKGKTFHDLRRTWGSDIINSGGTTEQVAELLGQKSTSITSLYTVHQMEVKRQVAQRAADFRAAKR